MYLNTKKSRTRRIQFVYVNPYPLVIWSYDRLSSRMMNEDNTRVHPECIKVSYNTSRYEVSYHCMENDSTCENYQKSDMMGQFNILPSRLTWRISEKELTRVVCKHRERSIVEPKVKDKRSVCSSADRNISVVGTTQSYTFHNIMCRNMINSISGQFISYIISMIVDGWPIQ